MMGDVVDVRIEDCFSPMWEEAKRFPLSKEAFADLKCSIRENGFWRDHPIELWKHDGKDLVVCGGHRLQAVIDLLQVCPRKTIPAVFVEFESELAARIHALQDNVARRNMPPEQILEAKATIASLEALEAPARADAEQRKIDAGREAGKKGGRGHKKPEEEKGPGTISRTLSDEHRARDVLARDLGVSGRQYEKMKKVRETDPVAWQEVLEGKKSTSKAYGDLQKREKKAEHEEKVKAGAAYDLEADGILKIKNIWDFSACDSRFGAEHPGRVPGQVVANLLWYFSEEGDLVIDSFAGSGTTLDVAKWMRRRCLAYDVAPARDDVKKRDAAKGLAKEAEGAALVYVDPPYFRQFDEKEPYSGDKADLANLAWPEYEKAMRAVLEDALAKVAVGGHVAAIASQTQVKGDVVDLPFLFELWLRKAGGEFRAKMVVPYAQSQFTGVQTDGAKRGRYVLKAYRELVVVRRTK